MQYVGVNMLVIVWLSYQDGFIEKPRESQHSTSLESECYMYNVLPPMSKTGIHVCDPRIVTELSYLIAYGIELEAIHASRFFSHIFIFGTK